MPFAVSLESIHIDRILIIRRDNIGDLVCTTPLIAAFRQYYPQAEIGALVNSYNAEILCAHPCVDRLFVYKKLKHTGGIGNRLLALVERLRLILAIRRWNPDITLLAKTSYDRHGLRFARQIGARRIIGIAGEAGQDQPDQIFEPVNKGHEVERLMHLLQPLGFDVEPIPALSLVPDPQALQVARDCLCAPSSTDTSKPLLGINISARLPSQQWPVASFAALIQQLINHFRVVLFWSPGSANNKMHPGDDEKADAIVQAAAVSAKDLCCYPTQQLRDLIAGIASVDIFLTPDGGAMHIAAACGKPVVALFGGADPEQWHPWGVPNKVLRPASHDVRDISVDEVLVTLQHLYGTVCPAAQPLFEGSD